MNTKAYIIELSKEYSIVTQFTSFVAIEKREEGEVVAEDAPTMEELVEKEDVDELAYMGYEKVHTSIARHAQIQRGGQAVRTPPPPTHWKITKI